MEVQLSGMFFICKKRGSKVSFLNASQIKPSHNHCQILNLSNISPSQGKKFSYPGNNTYQTMHHEPQHNNFSQTNLI